MAVTRLTPSSKDAALFLVWGAALVLGVVVAVSYGVDFRTGGGIAPWAAALLLLVGGVGAGLIAFWWYYVYADERAPARGEFTLEHRHVRGGAGSFRTKEPGMGVLREEAARGAGVRIERGMAFNRGATRKGLVAATVLVALGLALRAAGTLGGAGVPEAATLLGVLTIVAGVAAFVGFVVLDAA